MNALTTAALLVTLAAPPAPTPAIYPSTNEVITRSEADFAFLKPGITTIDEAVKELGPVSEQYDVRAIDDEVDVYTSTRSGRLIELSAIAESRAGDLVVLRRLQFTMNERKNGILFFRDGVLQWFNIGLISPTESTVAKVEARYGKPLACERFKVRAIDVIYQDGLCAYPEDGLLFFESDGRAITTKTVYKKGLKIAPGSADHRYEKLHGERSRPWAE